MPDIYLAPEAWLAAFDQTGRTFVAGSLLYSENLTEFIVFLALARGAADRLASAGHGLAVIQNVVWGDGKEKEVTAAIRMRPNGDTQFLPAAEKSSVGPAFQAIADTRIDGHLPPGFSVRSELHNLR